MTVRKGCTFVESLVPLTRAQSSLLSDSMNADEVDGDVDSHNTDGGVNTDEVESIADGVNANGLTGGMNQDTVDCFRDGAIDDMGTAASRLATTRPLPPVCWLLPSANTSQRTSVCVFWKSQYSDCL
jgi:hypothetical protein